VKNFPSEYTEDHLKTIFGAYGPIASIHMVTNETGSFSFVCFGDSESQKGHQAALQAVKELNEKPIDAKHTWYVKQALSKEERDLEKKKNMIRYKNSKKRCNLYVKNFPQSTTHEQLTELFQKFGEIESIKMFPTNEEPVYAFVCFKSPEAASSAKNQLNQSPFNGKQLYINHYEIKEYRKMHYEDMHDKTDFQNHIKQNTNINEIMAKPEIFGILNQIIQLLQL